jgi:hypothetical protein
MLTVQTTTATRAGQTFRIRMAASFEFPPSGDKIICECPYYDQTAVLRALGLG